MEPDVVEKTSPDSTTVTLPPLPRLGKLLPSDGYLQNHEYSLFPSQTGLRIPSISSVQESSISLIPNYRGLDPNSNPLASQPEPHHQLSYILGLDYSQISSPRFKVIFDPPTGTVGFGIKGAVFAEIELGKDFDFARHIILGDAPIEDLVAVFDEPTGAGIANFYLRVAKGLSGVCSIAEECNFGNPLRLSFDQPIKLSFGTTATFIEDIDDARIIHQATYGKWDVSARGSIQADGKEINNFSNLWSLLLNPRANTDLAFSLAANADYREQLLGSSLYLAPRRHGFVGFGYQIGQEKISSDNYEIDSTASTKLGRDGKQIVVLPEFELSLNQESTDRKNNFGTGIGFLTFAPKVGIPLFGNRYELKFDIMAQAGLTQNTYTSSAKQKQQIISAGGDKVPLDQLPNYLTDLLPITETTPINSRQDGEGRNLEQSYSLNGGLSFATSSTGWGLVPTVSLRETPDLFEFRAGAFFHCDKAINFSGSLGESITDKKTPFIQPEKQYAANFVYTAWSPEKDIAETYQRYLEDQNKNSLFLLSSDALVDDAKVRFYQNHEQLSLGVNFDSQGKFGGFLGFSEKFYNKPLWLEGSARTQDGNIDVRTDFGYGPLTLTGAFHVENDPVIKNQTTEDYKFKLRYDLEHPGYFVLLDLGTDPYQFGGFRVMANVVKVNWF